MFGDAAFVSEATSLVEHGGLGIDGDDLGDVRREPEGDLTGSATEVEHGLSAVEPEAVDEVVEECWWVAGAEAGVIGRGRGEQFVCVVTGVHHS
jgi:hypothetical protein